MKELFTYIILPLTTLVFGIFAFIYFLAALANKTKVQGGIAEIEQLRRDVRRVEAAKSEDVMGQVTKWNQRIVSNQRYNRLWYSALLIPNEWDSVTVIEVAD